uniref:Ankyrin repeat and SOCS box containing 2a, tandem duplicate 1 n=1 Tax=Oryzias sinensis TaxID=183150 RepID=A0A8C7Z653_9TELE
MADDSTSRWAPSPSLTFEDYSLYSNLSDDELLQLVIERSLSDTQCSAAAQPPHSHDSRQSGAVTNSDRPSYNPPNYSSQDPPAAQTPAHYSSPNPPSEKPPDLKTFDGTVSRFMTGSGKRMMAYYKADGNVVHIAPEPEEEEEPLFSAIREGNASKVKALTMCPEMNLMLPNRPGWLTVHQAVWFGQDSCLRVLLTAQPGMINKRTTRGETPLLIAVSREQLRCVEVLLERGAAADIPNNDKETPLYKACEKSNPAIVASLLNHGVAVNTPCIQGWTALQEAVVRDNVEICEMLMQAGAKHDIRNIYGITPLFTAAQTGQLSTLCFLLRQGADVNTQAADGATAIYEAAKNGHQQIVELLLSQSADANKPGKTGLLPLHIATQKGHNKIVTMLIPVTHKARVRRSGISPLHLAAEYNRNNALMMLIDAGFDVNAQLSEERSRLFEDRRSTALYFSVINSNIDAVQTLLTFGADTNLDVFRPLMVAARQGCMQTITLLVEHGADINASIPTHPTTFPAVFMFSMKYLPMFKYLLDHGGDAQSCFNCVYGNQSHPEVQITRSEWNEPHNQLLPETHQIKGVQFCDMISVPSISRWAGPIIDLLLDYVGDVALCSRLMEHLDSYSDWSNIKEKAAPPRPLLQLCRLRILQMVRHQKLKSERIGVMCGCCRCR